MEQGWSVDGPDERDAILESNVDDPLFESEAAQDRRQGEWDSESLPIRFTQAFLQFLGELGSSVLPHITGRH
jgi:hypothetical protein